MKNKAFLCRRITLWLAGFCMILPLLLIVLGSFMQLKELSRHISPVITGDGYATLPVLPEALTLEGYVKLLLDSPEYLHRFWNSCVIVLPSLLIQTAAGTMAAWAFARYEFPARRFLLAMYTVLMLLPFQVTMVPTYIVLNELGLIDTQAGVIGSQAFSAFAVFLLYRFFRSIPRPLIEAAQMDGGGEVSTFFRIAVPLGAPGIMSLLVLSFIELWSLVEPPLVFLKDQALWPLSLYQTQVTQARLDIAFVASVVTVIPPLLLFLYGQTYLEQGIQSMGIKG
jgi:ABC-type sugar transport system, permease component